MHFADMVESWSETNNFAFYFLCEMNPPEIFLHLNQNDN